MNLIRRRRWRAVSLDLWSQDTIPEPTEEEMEAIPEEKLLEWIAKLPDMRRAVFNLYCMDGYSHQEIGKMLGISEKGSASTLAKARRQLKEEIKRYISPDYHSGVEALIEDLGLEFLGIDYEPDD